MGPEAPIDMRRSLLDVPGRPRPWIMAHRGASDLAPENSIASFELAIAHGADLIETDLWFTNDRQLVCHHDPTFERMCGVARAVNDLSLAQIRDLRLEVGGKQPASSIPCLEELLELVPDRTPIILELKDPSFSEPAQADRLLDVIRPRIETGTVGIIGFELSRVLSVGARAPDLITGHIARLNPLPLQPTPLLGPFYPLLWLNPYYVKMAQRRGARVCPLDPDLHRRLPRYLALDVDAVLTNDPRATRARIEALRASVDPIREP